MDSTFGFNRRDFLKTAVASVGAAAMTSGCTSTAACRCGGVAKAMGLALPPMKKVRVGIVGLGSRGQGAPRRLALIPGCEITALCDLNPERVAKSAKWFADTKRPVPKGYSGDEECWKRLCNDSNVDVVYNALPWGLHAPVALYALEHGKHAMIEVPAAMTVEECWQLVETAERTGLHCMQLENGCYDELTLLEQRMCRERVFGELVHAQGSYLHDLRSYSFRDNQNFNHWRLRWNAEHKGDQYPTHGLVPMAKCLDINHGDQFDTLVSLGSGQFGMEEWARAHFPADSWKRKLKIAMSDMNIMLINTFKGRVICIKHDVTSPRPKSESDYISGTKGAIGGFPFRVHLNADSPVAAVHDWAGKEETAAVREKYMHPLWRDAGKIGAKVGGHGGCDFLMDLRWVYCMEMGLPLDMDVYDLAANCCTCELSERSVRSGGMPQKVPDFTRGAWKTARPPDIGTVDLEKLGLGEKDVKRDNAQILNA